MMRDGQHRLDDDHQQSRSSGCGAARHRPAPLPTPPPSPRPPRPRAGRRARAVPPTNAAPTRPITASPGMPSASAIAAWAAMIQKPTWRTCLATACLVALGELLGDDRGEDRIEAGLQLLRQRGDLLRDIIDPDPIRRDEQAEDGDVEPARAPFDRVGGGERHVAPRDREQLPPGCGCQPRGRP